MRKVAQKYSTLISTPLPWLDWVVLEELPWLLVKVVEPEWAYFKWIPVTSQKEGGAIHTFICFWVYASSRQHSKPTQKHVSNTQQQHKAARLHWHKKNPTLETKYLLKYKKHLFMHFLLISLRQTCSNHVIQSSLVCLSFQLMSNSNNSNEGSLGKFGVFATKPPTQRIMALCN
jgi:hypothetical protein